MCRNVMHQPAPYFSFPSHNPWTIVTGCYIGDVYTLVYRCLFYLPRRGFFSCAVTKKGNNKSPGMSVIYFMMQAWFYPAKVGLHASAGKIFRPTGVSLRRNNKGVDGSYCL
jgi:hypothetical protein